MMAHTAHSRAVINSPLGAATLDIHGASDIVIEVMAIDIPELPEGMIVDGAMLFAIRLGSPISRQSPLRIRVTADHEGGAESGQWLDSMAFGSAGGVLQVAVRDDEWLSAKGIIAEPVQYDRQGFTQVITEAPAGSVLYSSVAWRTASTGSPNDSSTWFAADLALPG